MPNFNWISHPFDNSISISRDSAITCCKTYNVNLLVSDWCKELFHMHLFNRIDFLRGCIYLEWRRSLEVKFSSYLIESLKCRFIALNRLEKHCFYIPVSNNNYHFLAGTSMSWGESLITFIWISVTCFWCQIKQTRQT